MSFEIKGKLYKKFDTVQIKDTFKKREFVLEIESGAYTQLIKFQLIQDRCDVINNHEEGNEINVFFELKGRAWTGRDGKTSYFTNLQAWKVDGVSVAPPQQQAPASSGNDDFPSASDAPPAMNDDLPF